MKTLFLLAVMLLSLKGDMLFEFKPDSNISDWRIVDDVVMGGKSEGNFFLNEDGNAVFTGKVSLENNGGFSSVRHRFQVIDMKPYSKVLLKLKGDGKKYQFRVKTSKYDRQSYIIYFKTSGEWQTLEIPLKDLYPSFRGMKLDMPNYPGESMEEIALLIANYKEEQFRLEIKEISFQ